MSVAFPVFVSSRDSGGMKKFSGIREMERALERVDVENEEYAAWDRSFRIVTMRVREGSSWLELHTNNPSIEDFRQALIRFAKSVNVEPNFGSAPATDAESLFDSIEKQISVVKSREGWFKRLIRRF